VFPVAAAGRDDLITTSQADLPTILPVPDRINTSLRGLTVAGSVRTNRRFFDLGHPGDTA
tara:strand:+ start:130 stop:309 length:180 start_codon:yes stop_codon:yes gene_type:complete